MKMKSVEIHDGDFHGLQVPSTMDSNSVPSTCFLNKYLPFCIINTDNHAYLHQKRNNISSVELI